MELAGNVTVSLCVLENWSSNSDMVILFIILPLNSLLFSGVDEISCDLVEGKAGVTACEHVCRTRQKFRASVSQPFERWVQLSVNNLIRH